MAHPHRSTKLARFEARVQKSKNRLVAIPIAVQRDIGLERRRNNHILLVSLRPLGQGRWNQHYVKLTYDNEFAIPADVSHIGGGDDLEITIHRVIADAEPVPVQDSTAGAGLLLTLAQKPRPGWREDGATMLDEYLDRELHDG